MSPSVYRLAESIVFRSTRPDLIMAFDSTSGVMYELNDTASSVLKLVDGSRSVDDIVDQLLDTYEAPRADVERDVTEILDRFATAAVVHRVAA